MMQKLLVLHREKIRYCIAGAWNTFFGWGVYALACYFAADKINYIILAVLSHIIAVTNAFFCYKFFVFRTKGNFLAEYGRTFAVYGAAFAANIGILALLVELLHIFPAVANVVSSLFIFIVSYFGHHYFSFRKVS